MIQVILVHFHRFMSPTELKLCIFSDSNLESTKIKIEGNFILLIVLLNQTSKGSDN